MTKCAFPPRFALVASLSLLALAPGRAGAAGPQLQPVLQGAWPGFLRGDAQALRVVGSHAYVAIGNNGLVVVDVKDPAKPFPVGGCDAGGYACGLDVAGGYAYVAAHAGGFQVLDVHDPARPVRAAACWFRYRSGQ